VLDSFIAAHTHAKAVRSESELMLDGDDDWKPEIFTLRQVRPSERGSSRTRFAIALTTHLSFSSLRAACQPQARLLDLLLVHPSLPALWTSSPAELALTFRPRRLTLWRLHPTGVGPKVELGSFDRSKGEGEDSLLERLLAILREGQRF
jgi:hypothetical protein